MMSACGIVLNIVDAKKVYHSGIGKVFMDTWIQLQIIKGIRDTFERHQIDFRDRFIIVSPF